jgi:hypothetical protein
MECATTVFSCPPDPLVDSNVHFVFVGHCVLLPRSWFLCFSVADVVSSSVIFSAHVALGKQPVVIVFVLITKRGVD